MVAAVGFLKQEPASTLETKNRKSTIIEHVDDFQTKGEDRLYYHEYLSISN